MTRINTNVSSLNAQKMLARSNAQLQESLTRLSTGLRITTGKDDPAGLIASEILRSDMASTQKAISNTERANQMIATADTALGQVTSLLNDIRSLVTEAANTGAMSADQIAANQLQVDSSLDALNRIAQTTSFQGRRLLDGSLDFITGTWTNQNKVSDLEIQQANLGASGSMAVTMTIATAATQATLNTTVSAGAAKSSAVVTFTDAGKITITAENNGAQYNDYVVTFVEDATVPAATPNVQLDDVAKTVKIYVNNAAKTTTAAMVAAFDEPWVPQFSAAQTVAGTYDPALDDAKTATSSGGTTGGLAANLVFELGGASGAQVFNFKAGALVSQMESAIDLVSDATGVTASVAGDVLTLTSSAYGTNAFVAVDVISGSQTFSASRATGTNVVARVNGYTATGDGNILSINSGTLALTSTVVAAFTGDISFTISGGGALFQLGPDVVTNQQSRMGITSVNTGSLGGSSGRLYNLGSGGTAALATNPNLGGTIVDQVLSKVSSLRGRLGAFQRTTLDTNVKSLGDTLENLTAAESSIRDADFAVESASLTRAQILVQSGTSVLAIANQNPQNVLALLRG